MRSGAHTAYSKNSDAGCPQQLSLFEAVGQVYLDAQGKPVQQKDLYARSATLMGLKGEDVSERRKLKNGSTYNVFERKCRFVQQTLKIKGLLKRVERGMWELTTSGKDELTRLLPGYVCLAFSTDLGVCIWGDAKDAAKSALDGPVHLLLTSPPYFNVKRNYGTYRDEKEYVKFVVEALEPVVEKMAPGGALVLNIGNDMFVKGKPERSMCLERLVLELHDALRLSLVDRVIWKANKCPGPTQWAFVNRYMLRSGFEYAFCFTNDPDSLQWDNREVLQEQNEEYLQWCQQGGQKNEWANSAYRKKRGSFSKTTKGKSRIPTNVLETGTHDRESREVKAYARQKGLPEHCATFPSRFAEFFIRWMTKKGDMVADTFGGWLTTAAVAERLERQWWISEMFLEFILAGSSRFDSPDMNPSLPR